LDAELVFEKRFRAKDTGWSIDDGELLKLKGQRILQPDFTLRKGKRTVHLEIVGFWRKGQLSSLIADCPENVFLLVSKRLAGDKSGIPKKLQSRVIPFAEVIPISKVLEAIT
jgi:predicted nuclease of restriction endonuclease-like RecB superfamily